MILMDFVGPRFNAIVPRMMYTTNAKILALNQGCARGDNRAMKTIARALLRSIVSIIWGKTCVNFPYNKDDSLIIQKPRIEKDRSVNTAHVI
jgi:hypothetical protein